MSNSDPNTTLLSVDQWIKDNVVPAKQRLIICPTTKKELNEAMKVQIGKAEDGYKLAGELFQQLQRSIDAMKKFSKQVEELKQHTDPSSIISDLKAELTSSIEQKFQELTDRLPCIEMAVAHSKVSESEERHSIILQCKDSDGNPEPFTKPKWSEVVKSTLSAKLTEVPVTKLSLTSEGKGYVTFPNKESCDMAAKALKDDFVVVECIPKNNPT